MDKLKSILVRFRVGGMGGIRGPTLDETIEALRLHGFPKELKKEAEKILKNFRNHRNSREYEYRAEDAENDLLTLLQSWQRKKKGGRNAVLSPK